MKIFRNRTLWVYGACLALLAWLLQLMQYRHQLKLLPTQGYVVLIAVIFTVLGVWAGRRLSASARPVEFIRNDKAKDYLGISDREMEVLELLAKGGTNQEIADRLFVSANTVKTHLAHVYGKLDVSRRTQAVRKARQLKLIP